MKKNIYPVRLSGVSLTEPCLKKALKLEIRYLLSLDPDRWLSGFRETAGLDTLGKSRYPGWENSLIGGHAFGHFISACARAVCNPDVSTADRDKLCKNLTYIVDVLEECQENTKGKPGFIFCATLPDKKNVELQFDNVEKGNTNIFKEAWVPWYTMHKILQGLIDVYKFTGYKPALKVAKGLGDWVYGRTSKWSAKTRTKTLETEYGGMNDCLYELYAITGKYRYAVAAHAFDEEKLFKKVLTGAPNVLNNLHANTTIPKFLGALKRYYCLDGKKVYGKTVDAGIYLEYAKAFFAMVRDRHTYITGGNSEWEHFGADGVLDAERTNANNETCNVYNMLKLARLLFMITGDVQYADFYENGYINSILSSQDPKTGMTTYFQAMATGYFKVYSEPYTKFWCCTGTGMENFTKLGDSIYFTAENKVFVNLYISSCLDLAEEGFGLLQESEVLNGKGATFTVVKAPVPAKEITLSFRIPDWAAGKMNVSLNGKKAPQTAKDGYFSVTRAFKEGDTLTVDIPMELRAFALPDNPASIGFKYGPLVLSAGLGSEDMVTTTTGVDVTIPAEKRVESETITLPRKKTAEDLLLDPAQFFESSKTSISFKLKGTSLKFTPHYLRHHERYGIYWYFEPALRG
ncbi:MAG: glycoside hydrolase family 127 protein [Lachnospiraceae bacterium]|nr:glycoside hydrolase family 127 protein [Lachnospiraceae bacterium]